MSVTNAVTHRLIRHARCDIAGKILTEGSEPEPFAEVEWRATCACNRVFVAPTDLACSAAYLAHLPKPVDMAPFKEGFRRLGT